MLPTEWWDRLLPIATLLLGAVLTRAGQRPTSRREAAEKLAGLQRQLWTRGDDGAWLDFQEFLGRLTVALRTAGVPRRLTERLVSASDAFWKDTTDSGDSEVGWYLVHDYLQEDFDRARSDVLDW